MRASSLHGEDKRVTLVEPAAGRDASGPVVEGDMIDDRKVLGFVYAFDQVNPASLRDRLLMEGDDMRGGVPAWVVPATATEADRQGVPAVDRLGPGQRSAATPQLIVQVEEMLRRPDAQWRSIALPLFDELYAAGHEVWVAGGGVRDLVAGGIGAEVNDLDLSGTAPPGRFEELLLPMLQRYGHAESVFSVSKDTLVVYTKPVEQAELDGTYVEYRSLALDGYPFPGTSSDFTADAAKRDITFNALHYDRRRKEVLDPTARGLADLTAPVRRFVSCRSARDARSTAVVVLRSIKLAARWERAGIAVDLDGLWEVPPGPWHHLVGEVWGEICDDYDDILTGNVTVEEQRRLATRLGPEAVALIARLLGETP